ncbi:MAG: EVE domain-containing protein [Candidatus Babeliales bacterium]
MPRYWIAVASREHVLRGIAGGFMQVCHGKQAPLKRMSPEDWIIYYSPTDLFGSKALLRTFTAIGRVKADMPYTCQMSEDFIPWRRNINFVLSHESAIEPLINQLSFIHNKIHWGFPFRRGFFEIMRNDFAIIARSMGVTTNDKED